MSVAGFFVYLLLSSIFALIVNLVVPGRIPGGFVAGTIVGIIGGVIAAKLGPVEPSLAGVAILPAGMGALIMVICLAWMGTSQKRFRKKA